jgi:hypothetical protein
MKPRSRMVPKRLRDEILRVLDLSGEVPLLINAFMGSVALNMFLQAARDVLAGQYPDIELYYRQDDPETPGQWRPTWRLEVRRA